jgi:hypothetical protein
MERESRSLLVISLTRWACFGLGKHCKPVLLPGRMLLILWVSSLGIKRNGQSST